LDTCYEQDEASAVVAWSSLKLDLSESREDKACRSRQRFYTIQRPKDSRPPVHSQLQSYYNGQQE
jgi:hypothetical protein